VQRQCKSDTLADPYQEYSAGDVAQRRSTAEVPPAELVFHPHQSASRRLQQGAPAQYIFPTPVTPPSVFQPRYPLRQEGIIHQIDPDFPPSQFVHPHSFSSAQPSQFAIAQAQPQQPYIRGTKRIRTEDDSPTGDQSVGPLLPDTPSTMTSMTHSQPLQPSFHLMSHRDQFYPHHMSQHHYQPIAMHQHHHHRLPAQTRHESLPNLSHVTQADMMPSHSTLVGQEGMPEPASRPRGPKLKFSSQEDQMLVDLKENKNLTWKQIADFFPGRTSGTLQVRYCTKLKAKTVIWTEDNVSIRFRTKFRHMD
jgi:Myb-like DNA-binding domain